LMRGRIEFLTWSRRRNDISADRRHWEDRTLHRL